MKKISALLLCLVLAFCLVSCSSGGSKLSSHYPEDSFKETIGTSDGSGVPADSQEKIIKTVNATIQTKEYDACLAGLRSSVTSNGGYIEKSDENVGYSDSRFITITARIPADKLDAFLTAAEEKGRITHKSESLENVTLEYVDIESRISAYETEKATLTGLLEKASSLEDVLAIQERLSDVNYQLETYTAQLKVLENRVSYSTVTLDIDEVERVSEEEPSIWSQIKDSFSDNLEALGDGLRSFVVGLIGGLPIIIPIAVLAIAVILILRAIIKKRRK